MASIWKEQRENEEIERQVVRLWRIWRTVHEMVADRGYEVSEEEIHLPLDQFKAEYTSGDKGWPDRRKMKFSARPSDEMIEKYKNIPMLANPTPNEPAIGTIWVEFLEDNSIGIKQMRNFAQYIDQQKFYTGIMITQAPPTSAANKLIPTVLPAIIESFVEQDLVVNITQHELVPKHILLSQAEKEALLHRYRLRESQLPRIQATDPVARYLALRRSQVVKIIRRSETAGRYASYRVVL
ncbi:MAG: DNA-directed RNA polymerases II 24 kDa polypeptide (RNA polymerase II subunit 5) [Lichina confinis]|nr:MAG: DNA-directed RNA polymerases II 24 kDa polypeptide (RNA polymerase II subunit 5) [Lichina confinis]